MMTTPKLPPSSRPTGIDLSSYSVPQLTDLAKIPGPVGLAAQRCLVSNQNVGVPDGVTAERAAQAMLGSALWANLTAEQQAALTATATAQAAVAQIVTAEQSAQQTRTAATAAIQVAQVAISSVSLPADQQGQVQTAIAAAQQAAVSLQALTDAGMTATSDAQAAIEATSAAVANVLPITVQADVAAGSKAGSEADPAPSQ